MATVSMVNPHTRRSSMHFSSVSGVATLRCNCERTTEGTSTKTTPSFSTPPLAGLSWAVPEPLRREWEEAQACFDAKAYAACFVMVHRTVAGTCNDHGTSKRTLTESLDELRTHGLIDGTLAAWADALRLAGNEGAHYTGMPVHGRMQKTLSASQRHSSTIFMFSGNDSRISTSG